MREIIDLRAAKRMPTEKFIETHGAINMRYPHYYSEPRRVIDRLHRELLYRKGFHRDTHPDTYKLLIGWFPTVKKQVNLEQGVGPDLTKFIAHSLGNYAVYDALSFDTPENEDKNAKLLGVTANHLRTISKESSLFTASLFKYFHNLWGEFPTAAMFEVSKQITTLAEIQGYNSVYGDYPKLNLENLLGSV